MDKATQEDKREFIRHFLERQELKNRLCYALLNYLCTYDELLEKLHFVSNARAYDHAMVITAKYMDYVPFAFYSKGFVSADPESVFKTLQVAHKTNQFNDLYIQVNFIGKESNYRYLNILETRSENRLDQRHHEEDKKVAAAFIDVCIEEFLVNDLTNKIDKALDERNKSDFTALSAELIDLLNKKKQTG